jgi:hypothetical protein
VSAKCQKQTYLASQFTDAAALPLCQDQSPISYGTAASSALIMTARRQKLGCDVR